MRLRKNGKEGQCVHLSALDSASTTQRPMDCAVYFRVVADNRLTCYALGVGEVF